MFVFKSNNIRLRYILDQPLMLDTSSAAQAIQRKTKGLNTGIQTRNIQICDVRHHNNPLSNHTTEFRLPHRNQQCESTPDE